MGWGVVGRAGLHVLGWAGGQAWNAGSSREPCFAPPPRCTPPHPVFIPPPTNPPTNEPPAPPTPIPPPPHPRSPPAPLDRSWRVDVFQMVERSNRWIPPPMTAGLSKAAAAHQTAAQRGRGPGDASGDAPLSELQREKFVGMLRRLTVERADICAGMAFALDNAESGEGRKGGGGG